MKQIILLLLLFTATLKAEPIESEEDGIVYVEDDVDLKRMLEDLTDYGEEEETDRESRNVDLEKENKQLANDPAMISKYNNFVDAILRRVSATTRGKDDPLFIVMRRSGKVAGRNIQKEKRRQSLKRRQNLMKRRTKKKGPKRGKNTKKSPRKGGRRRAANKKGGNKKRRNPKSLSAEVQESIDQTEGEEQVETVNEDEKDEEEHQEEDEEGEEEEEEEEEEEDEEEEDEEEEPNTEEGADVAVQTEHQQAGDVSRFRRSLPEDEQVVLAETQENTETGVNRRGKPRRKPQGKGKRKRTKKPKNRKRKSAPEAKATLTGLSSIKRVGNVKISETKGAQIIRANLAVGPIFLRAEKKVGRGKQRVLRKAEAMSPNVKGRIEILVTAKGVARVKSFRLFKPSSIRIAGTLRRDPALSSTPFMKGYFRKAKPYVGKVLAKAARKVFNQQTKTKKKNNNKQRKQTIRKSKEQPEKQNK